jgi:UDP-N-acetylmuramate--alanine ligase
MKHVYFSGILGKGLSALAMVASDAGFKVFGSDRGDETASEDLLERGIDWFVYTSALPENHPELALAKELGIKVSKRGEFLADFLEEKRLKLVAVAGTDGKGTTAAMILWTLMELGVPTSQIIGAEASWLQSGKFDLTAKYFVYEADEYDRNFLWFHPEISIITSVHYDHPEIYPTEEDYFAAFEQFRRQSKMVIENVATNAKIRLRGEFRRYDASLALAAIRRILPEASEDTALDALNKFPGLKKRFEKIGSGVYADYAHHPRSIKATLEMARETAKAEGFAGVTAIYEPLQNIRQYEVYGDYPEAFALADKVYWLPTYLTREERNPMKVLEPEFFVQLIGDKAEAARLSDKLATKIREARDEGQLVLVMAGGHSDEWVRNNLI